MVGTITPVNPARNRGRNQRSGTSKRMRIIYRQPLKSNYKLPENNPKPIKKNFRSFSFQSQVTIFRLTQEHLACQISSGSTNPRLVSTSMALYRRKSPTNRARNFPTPSRNLPLSSAGSVTSTDTPFTADGYFVPRRDTYCALENINKPV